MMDALLPATDAFQRAIGDGDGGQDWQRALAAAVDAANKGAESTSDLVRRKGRGSFLGERAKGHKDAGAQAVALIFGLLLHILAPGTKTVSHE
jgi:dihydroxyacetone kinase-like protein